MCTIWFNHPMSFYLCILFGHVIFPPHFSFMFMISYFLPVLKEYILDYVFCYVISELFVGLNLWVSFRSHFLIVLSFCCACALLFCQGSCSSELHMWEYFKARIQGALQRGLEFGFCWLTGNLYKPKGAKSGPL